MGIDRASLTERQRELLDPEARQELGLKSPSERHARLEARLERDEQNTFAAWLGLREADGVLVYDWSRMDRRTTNRRGLPDFRIYAQAQALLGEMKTPAGKLSSDQEVMIQKFERSGTEVQVWYSALEGIEAVRNWLFKL